MIQELLEPIAALILSMVGVGLFLLYARRTGLIDIPNHRSSHRVPTPRGGGIGIVVSVLVVGALHLQPIGQRSWSISLMLVVAVAVLTGIGWMDDRRSLHVAIRLAIHVGCGIAVALLVNEIAPLPSALNIAWLALWAFWTVASINIVNFMDGIDGMIAAQGIIYGIFLFALLPPSTEGSRLGLVLAAGCLGFIIWNWAPAKVFLGDAGSGPLGLFFAVGGALALNGASAAVVFLPLYPLFLDALLTIVIRFRRGERLSDAHRSHLYQRLANGKYGHARVTLTYALGAAVGAVVAVWAKDRSTVETLVAILGYVAAVSVAWKVLHTRVPDLHHRSPSAVSDADS